MPKVPTTEEFTGDETGFGKAYKPLGPGQWPPLIRSHTIRPIPYGYIQKEGDPLSLIPVPEVIAFVEQALDSIDMGTSLREAAAWLSQKTGLSLTHAGIAKIWDRLRKTEDNPRTQRLLLQGKKVKGLSRQEQYQKRLKRKLGVQKQRRTTSERKIQKLTGVLENIEKKVFETEKPSEELVQEILESIPEEVTREAVFTPHAGPQYNFLASSEQEVLYGGAAGGGKSYAMLADPVRYFDNPNFSGILFRKTNDELRELIQKSQFLYKAYDKAARFNSQEKLWKFPSGATLWMTYLEQDKDVQRYQGQGFTWIGFDELTQYPTAFPWNYMRTRLRDPSGTLPLYMRATTNPGGPGHGWVKRMFIDPAPYGESFDAVDEDGKPMLIPHGDDDFPKERWGKAMFQRKFLPAKLSDNPSLAKGGQYKANLLSQPEHIRRQLLEGDWSIAEGAAFPEFRMHLHVTPKSEIPHDWRRFRSCDFGYASWSAVHWFAVDPADETLIVYRELYVTKHTGRDLARKIMQIERDANERVQYGVLDSACWHVRGNSGPTIAEEMINEGTRFRPSDKGPMSRVAGRNRLHELLKVKDNGAEGRPGIIFMENCRQIISDLPVIPTDPDGGDDIDGNYAHDHAYDSIRYGIMTRPHSHALDWGNQRTEMSYQPQDNFFGY